VKLSFSQNKRALTRLDVIVAVFLAILLFALLFAMVLPIHEAVRRRSENITCINNLKQINMACRVWEGDNGSITNAFVAAIRTNVDTVGLNSGQIAWINLMRPSSNILSSLKILQCPSDHETPTTTNSAGLKIRISYFLNLDANEGYPQQLLSGDDNLVLGKPGQSEPVEGFVGPPVKPGILLISTNTLVSWTRTRHVGRGNVSLADGSVSATSSMGLQNAVRFSLEGTPFPTNRIAIP
jgi:prepilin-type processing-associated H-X9-DG protein